MKFPLDSSFCRLLVLLFITLPLLGADDPKQKSGNYEFSLRLPPEGLFAQEEIEVAFHVATVGEDGGTPLKFARIHATIDMPSMPAMPKFDQIAHSHGIPGQYGAHPIFAHGGEYRLRLNLLSYVEAAGTVSTGMAPVSVEFPLEVKDATPNRPAIRPKPFELLLTTSPASPKAGEPVTLELGVRLVNSLDGRLAKEFDTVHEKLMHVFLVRVDFGQFAHEHPEPGNDGKFRLRYSFRAGGVYRVFVDVAPKGAGSQILMADLTVGGDPGSQWNIYEASKSDPGLKQTLADMTLEWKLPSAVLPTRRTIVITAQLHDGNGKPVSDLEPYLGAMGHLLLINQDTQTFVHSHPDDRNPNPPGTIPFLARFPAPGLYRGWLQVQRKGEVKTAPFILNVE